MQIPLSSNIYPESHTQPSTQSAAQIRWGLLHVGGHIEAQELRFEFGPQFTTKLNVFIKNKEIKKSTFFTTDLYFQKTILKYYWCL